MTETTKLSLHTHATSAASAPNMGPQLADQAINCVRAILVSTRPLKCGQHVYQFTPWEFRALVGNENGGITRGHMTGAALFIDAQPVYDSGRTFHTIRTEEVLQLARLAIEQFGKVLQHIAVVCDENEADAIKAAIRSELGETEASTGDES